MPDSTKPATGPAILERMLAVEAAVERIEQSLMDHRIASTSQRDQVVERVVELLQKNFDDQRFDMRQLIQLFREIRDDLRAVERLAARIDIGVAAIAVTLPGADAPGGPVEQLNQLSDELLADRRLARRKQAAEQQTAPRRRRRAS